VKRIKNLYQILRLLGWEWAFFRLRYAFRKKTGALKRRAPCKSWTQPESEKVSQFFFSPSDYLEYRTLIANCLGERSNILSEADDVCDGQFRFYQSFDVSLGDSPDWHKNPVTGEQVPAKEHWSALGDFAFGDIKHIWELSRFPWAFTLLRAYAATGDEKYSERFWTLFDNWIESNPPNHGVNWKCGQEIAFRAMACSFAFFGFEGSSFLTTERRLRCISLFEESARRIFANIDYAISQNNNHGVSEAVLLWGIGVILPDHSEADRWRRQGMFWMKHQAQTLIDPNGAFSQHSLNYHRVMLDAYQWAFALARANSIQLPACIFRQCSKAASYLRAYVQLETGLVPVWGANDGAHILPLQSGGYSDFRGCLQASLVSFTAEQSLGSGIWDERLFWLGLSRRPKICLDAPSEETSDHVIIKNSSASLYLRLAGSWQFRPSHADLLHVDIFVEGSPVVVDTGSYSYNDPKWSTKFSSTGFHNTITFDGRDQFPRISRFLFGDWRTTIRVASEGLPTLSYEDAYSCNHTRSIKLVPNGFDVIDRVSGPSQAKVLRWHLSGDLEWKNTGATIESSKMNIHIEASSEFEISLESGWASKFYGVRSEIRVLTCVIAENTDQLITKFRLPYSMNRSN